MTTKTWRCSRCALNWPFNRQYATCLQCGEECSEMKHEPMAQRTADELERELRLDREAAADRQAKRTAFEVWYEEREVAKFRAELDSQALLSFTALPDK